MASSVLSLPHNVVSIQVSAQLIGGPGTCHRLVKVSEQYQLGDKVEFHSREDMSRIPPRLWTICALFCVEVAVVFLNVRTA